ncbi:MAG: hypothetical protein ACFFBD_05790 [Candidatus Hodarchaeota archaeon]
MSFEIERKSRRKRRWGRVYEYTSFERRLVVGDDFERAYNIIKDMFEKRNRLVTPEKIAEETNIRVSSAKKILKNLEKEGIIELALNEKHLKVYRPKK